MKVAVFSSVSISLSLCSRRKDRDASLSSPHKDPSSLFGARKFLIKRQKADETEDETQDKYDDAALMHEVILKHGDIITMEGMFQNHYYHSVWPGDSQEHMDDPFVQGERINLTWRTIVQHLDGSEEECRGKICPLSINNRDKNDNMTAISSDPTLFHDLPEYLGPLQDVDPSIWELLLQEEGDGEDGNKTKNKY